MQFRHDKEERSQYYYKMEKTVWEKNRRLREKGAEES